MIHQAFYLVRAKQTLRDRLSKMAGDVADLLLEPTLFSRGEADRASWSREDYLAAAKLTYLASLVGDYGESKEFSHLFAEGNLSLEAFDAYWEIERYYFPEDINAVMQKTDGQVIGRLQKTGRPTVDGWLEDLAMGKKGEPST